MRPLYTSGTEEMVCPYCGEVESGSHELESDDSTNICGSCEREYAYSRNVEITYRTSEIEGTEVPA